jgi:hypothetical protein
MSVQTCGRCGQLLLPEIVQELGQGKRCPFCGAELEERAVKAEAAPRARQLAVAAPASAPPVRASAPPAVPSPGVPAPRPRSTTARTTALRVSGASPASSPAMALAVALSTPPPEKPSNPVLTFVPTPAPEVALPPAPTLPVRVPAPTVDAWPVAARRRQWLAIPVVALALIGITLFIGHALSGKRTGGPTAPVVVPPPVAQAAPAEPADPPPAADPVVEQKPPAAVADDSGGATVDRRKVHRSAHERRSARSHKERSSRASSKKHGREVALQAPASPAQPGDDSAARAAYAKGNRLLLGGDTGGAIAAYEEAIRAAPASPAGYRGLGLAYEKQGNSAQATRAFRKYLKLAPGAEDHALIAERLQRLASQHKTSKRSH